MRKTAETGGVDFDFVSDHLALDFAGTLSWRTTDRVDLLTAPADLARWVHRSGLSEEPPKVTAAMFRTAVELREAVYRAAASVPDGTRADPADLALIRRTAQHPGVVPQLWAIGEVRRSGDLTQVLASLAVAASDLLGTAERHHIRVCARPNCTRLFLDRSRAASRRWCDKLRCGSSANSAAYRRRRQTRQP
ncbi:ABATE domain-containing protein [Streptomyces shenzhenensis]|uniref:CGNR zinc finger domain-containing protein n=1 Tax=Streptomyces shenzhenensis TaxID=943815 RepID=UPI00217DEB91|nr:ABATE domain-containing protein [Streptomyces shenzhenensis]